MHVRPLPLLSYPTALTRITNKPIDDDMPLLSVTTILTLPPPLPSWRVCCHQRVHPPPKQQQHREGFLYWIGCACKASNRTCSLRHWFIKHRQPRIQKQLTTTSPFRNFATSVFKAMISAWQQIRSLYRSTIYLVALWKGVKEKQSIFFYFFKTLLILVYKDYSHRAGTGTKTPQGDIGSIIPNCLNENNHSLTIMTTTHEGTTTTRWQEARWCRWGMMRNYLFNLTSSATFLPRW